MGVLYWAWPGVMQVTVYSVTVRERETGGVLGRRETDVRRGETHSSQLEPGQTAPPRQVSWTGGRPSSAHTTPGPGPGPGPQEAGGGGGVGSVVVGVGVLGEVSVGEEGGGRLAVSGQLPSHFASPSSSSSPH